MPECRCGCGLGVRGKRVFVNKEHQLEWMLNGGAREMNALLPDEARALGGHVSGKIAVATGRQKKMAAAGAKRSRELAETFKARRNNKKPQ